jgi:paraquat-inducible protein A
LQKFGRVRTTVLTVGFDGFWSHGFESLGVWVLLCGILAPLGLLALLVAVLYTDRRPEFRELNARLRRWADGIQYWAMPEVQVLGVMVAFFKLGDVVNVTIGPGLWCYAVASLFTLLAWRRFNLQPRQERLPALSGAKTS